MTVVTSSGTKPSISYQEPATFDEKGFSDLGYVEVGSITGERFYKPLKKAKAKKIKGKIKKHDLVATNHQIKQAVNRLMNEFVGTSVQVQYLGNSSPFNNVIWVVHNCRETTFIDADKDLSLNVTKTILKIKGLMRDIAHSN